MKGHGGDRRSKHRGNVEHTNRDDYRTVTAILRVVRERSFTIEKPRGGRETLARSLIHAADDLALNGMVVPTIGTTWTFRLRTWKAVEIGLA